MLLTRCAHTHTHSHIGPTRAARCRGDTHYRALHDMAKQHKGTAISNKQTQQKQQQKKNTKQTMGLEKPAIR